MVKIYKEGNRLRGENIELDLVFNNSDDRVTFETLFPAGYEFEGQIRKNKDDSLFIKKIRNHQNVVISEKNVIQSIKYYPMIISQKWKNTGNINFLKNNCSNYSLAIDKFARFYKDKLDYIDYNGQANLYHNFNINKTKLTGAQTKETELKKLLKESGYQLTEIELYQKWRMVIGLGNTTGYNNGFLLHKLYGVPYLPSSSIKGIIRTHTILEYFNGSEKKAANDPDFVRIFGTNDELGKENQRGKVRFADAFPVNNTFKIEADIMNSHNKNYYDPGKNTYPRDSENPNPLKFLSLKNARFTPYFYIPENDNTTIKIGDKEGLVLEVLLQLAIEAFEYQGIGAKTNVGYGRFKETPESKKLRIAKKNEIKERRKNEERKKKITKSGLSILISEANNFGELKKKINEYKKIVNINDNSILKAKDIEVLIKWLDTFIQYSHINKSAIKKKERKNFLESIENFNHVKSWIGEENATKWFNSKKKK